MRGFVLAAASAAALSASPAAASTIVQDVTGTNRAGSPLNLFDPALGTLNSVQIEGTMTWHVDLVRNSAILLPAVNLGSGGVGSLLLQPSGTPVATATLGGSEVYPAGSFFGAIDLSGTLFALLMGSAVNPFLVVGTRTTGSFQPSASVGPQVGSILSNPASPGGAYSVRVTYDFTPVPEPSGWAMMLLGFAGIGLALRYKRGSRLAPKN